MAGCAGTGHGTPPVIREKELEPEVLVVEDAVPQMEPGAARVRRGADRAGGLGARCGERVERRGLDAGDRDQLHVDFRRGGRAAVKILAVEVSAGARAIRLMAGGRGLGAMGTVAVEHRFRSHQARRHGHARPHRQKQAGGETGEAATMAAE